MDVAARNPKSIEEAIRLATTFEDCRYNFESSPNLRSSSNNLSNKFKNRKFSNNNKSNYKSYNNNNNNNNNSSNPRKFDGPKQAQDGKKPQLCYLCKKPGQKQRDCKSGSVNIIEDQNGSRDEFVVVNSILVEDSTDPDWEDGIEVIYTITTCYNIGLDLSLLNSLKDILLFFSTNYLFI